MIKIGNLDISAAKLGNDDVQLYLGNTKIYPVTPPTPSALTWVEYNSGDTINATNVYGVSGVAQDIADTFGYSITDVDFIKGPRYVECTIDVSGCYYTNEFGKTDTVELIFSNVGCNDYYTLSNAITAQSTVKIYIYQSPTPTPTAFTWSYYDYNFDTSTPIYEIEYDTLDSAADYYTYYFSSQPNVSASNAEIEITFSSYYEDPDLIASIAINENGTQVYNVEEANSSLWVDIDQILGHPIYLATNQQPWSEETCDEYECVEYECIEWDEETGDCIDWSPECMQYECISSHTDYKLLFKVPQ